MPGVAKRQGVVGKGCITVVVVSNVGDASSAIALHGPRNVAGPRVAPSGVEEARVKRNSISRPAEPGSAAEGGYAILAPEIKEIRAGEVQHGIEVGSLVSRGFQGKPPRSVACLNRLVGRDD